MNVAIAKKLEALRNDYREIAGDPVQNFYCPILFRDDPADLCKAHLVNQAFPGSCRRWIVQRADVDNFFGSIFESDFLHLRHRGSSVEKFYKDPASMKRLGPQLYLNGSKVDYYVPKGAVSSEHSELRIPSAERTVRLALKVKPDEMPRPKRMFLEVDIELDCRMSALVSILKAAHLTMFEMLGYRYALSAGGLFLGHTVLGKFFLANRGLTKRQIMVNAETHFAEFSNLVRPVLNPEVILRDTVNDRVLCFCEGLSTWAFLIYVRTSDLVHAALVPVLDSPDAAAHFVKFLNAKGSTIHARECHFDGETFHVAPVTQRLLWPEAQLR